MPLFLSVQILIIIIGRLGKKDINIHQLPQSREVGGSGGGGGNLHVGKGLTGEDGSSQPLSTSQHLVLIVGDDFHRITEIRDRKDLLGHLAQLSASIELFSVRKTTSLFSQKALILSNGFPTEDGFKWTPEVKELKNY